MNKSFPQIVGLIKELKIFLNSVDKKQDAFGIFTNWFQQEFDLPVASLDVKRNVRWNFECSVVIVTLLVLIMKDKAKELSNLGLKAFAIGAGD